MKQLTKQQHKVYVFLDKFFKLNDQLPTLQAICDEFGFNSPNGAYEHLRALETKGLIEKNSVNKWRFTRTKMRYEII